MRKLYVLFGIGLALFAVGCSSEGDAGDVKGGEKAAAEMPKKPEDLPQDMPPEARKQAEAAMAQGNAMQQHMNEQMAKAKPATK